MEINQKEIQWGKYDRIVIIGLPATGKTYLADTLAQSFHIFHTDDYMEEDYEDALYHLMDDVRRCKEPRIVVEGVQGYRFLRKLAQRGMKQPDLIIKCVASMEVRQQRYKERGKKFNRMFDNNLTKVWMDYVQLMQDKKTPDCFMYDTITDKIMGDQIL